MDSTDSRSQTLELAIFTNLSASYSYNRGWRTSAVFGNTTYAYNGFDGLGRVTYAMQTTNGHPYTFSFCPNGLSGFNCIGASGYNLIDEVASMTLPSGTAVTSAYDTMGRPSGVSAQAASHGTVYANSASYTPAGALQQLSLGNGLTEQTCYNDRQQPFVILQRFTGATSCSNADANDMGYLGFTFPGGNNGNVSSQTIQYGATPHGPNPAFQALSFTQNYAYDQANRLASVQETSSANWSQYFGYDAMGNRWLYSGAQFDPSTPVTGNIDPFDANNHLNSAGYDARGNQTGDGGYAFQYDEEGRLTSSSMSASTLATYAYDADGHRVTKVAGAEATVYVYNPQGELGAEYTTGATTTPCATTCYLMTDHLGSTRMQTDVSGNQIQLFDYAPFGEMLGNAGGRDGRWAGYTQSGVHFTGKEQEGYEGAYMHYFGARYFSGGLGRFSSPDPEDVLPQKLTDPQQWNKYAYARDNPVVNIDPDGKRVIVYTEIGGVGHTFIWINNDNHNVVFSFGRYAGGSFGHNWRGLSPWGPGTLMRIEGQANINQFIANRLLNDQTLGRATINVPDEDAAYSILQSYYDQGAPLDARQKAILGQSPTINPETARVTSEFFLLTNNCTTTVCHALREGGARESFFTWMPFGFRMDHPDKRDDHLNGTHMSNSRAEAARLCVASGGTNPSACGVAVGQ